MGAATPACSLGPSLPGYPLPLRLLPSTQVLQPPGVEAPQGACAWWEAECQDGAVELSPGRWHQAGPAVGRGASSQEAKENCSWVRCLWNALGPGLGCTILFSCQPTPALTRGRTVPGPPRGCRGAASGTNNSWRTNNLTCWSAGGEPSWGASPAAPALPCPQGQPAAGQGRGSSSEAAPARQRCGVALVAEPPIPSASPVAPPNLLGAGSSPAHWQP